MGRLSVSLLFLTALLLPSQVGAQSFSNVTIPFINYKNRPDLPPIKFQQGAPEEGGKKADTGTVLAKVAFQPGQAPLVMLMHGCGGLNNTPTEFWVKTWTPFFWEKGYSVMVIDSFTTRGVSDVCGAPAEAWSWRRRDDAFSALDWLATQGKTDMKNVILIGRSNGGNVALRVMDANINGARPYHFKQTIAMYPWCAKDAGTKFIGPVNIYIGADDDANKAEYCAAMKQSNVKVTIYPNTYHGFDDGTRSHVDHGWRLGYNPNSTSAAKADITSSLGR